jgi:hypothetical protein
MLKEQSPGVRVGSRRKVEIGVEDVFLEQRRARNHRAVGAARERFT